MKEVGLNNLRTGHVKSCGCLCKEISSQEKVDYSSMLGKTFGRLTPVDILPTNVNGKRKLKCQCSCGNVIETYPSCLSNGDTTSCGCFKSEKSSLIAFKHGHANITGIRGNKGKDAHSEIFNRWLAIKSTIRQGVGKANKGIISKVCHEYDPRCDDFTNFLADFGEITFNQTIKRINNQTTWCKDNCEIVNK